jgi:DNA replication protein DnaC
MTTTHTQKSPAKKKTTMIDRSSSPLVPHGLDEELVLMLKHLRLGTLLARWDAIMEAAHERGDSPESFLRSVIRTEYESKRENARLQRRQRANIPEPWEIETFPFARQPTLDRQRVMSYYHSFEYMTKQRNLVWLGPTGCGKTGLATSFLLQALDRGYRGYFVTFPEWGSFLHNPHLTSALIDRLTENCHTINIKDGVSLRDKLPE